MSGFSPLISSPSYVASALCGWRRSSIPRSLGLRRRRSISEPIRAPWPTALARDSRLRVGLRFCVTRRTSARRIAIDPFHPFPGTLAINPVAAPSYREKSSLVVLKLPDVPGPRVDSIYRISLIARKTPKACIVQVRTFVSPGRVWHTNRW